jgi:PAS domain S-box-containing protein
MNSESHDPPSRTPKAPAGDARRTGVSGVRPLTRWEDQLLRLLTPERLWNLPAVWRYGLMVVMVAASVALRWAMIPEIGKVTPYSLALLTMVIVTVLLGLGPGLASIVLCDVGVELFILGSGPHLLEGQTLLRLGVSMVIGLAMVGLFQAFRVAAIRIRDSEARLSAFAGAAFEGIVESQGGRIMDCNEQFASLVGLSITELRGKAISDLVAPQDREWVLENIRLNRESVIEHAMVLPGGRRIVVETHGRPMGTGSATRFTAVRDVTERKRAEEALRAAEARFRVVTANTPDHVLVQDRDLRYTLVVNPQLGLTEQEILGKTDHDFLPAADADRLMRLKRQVLETGKALHVELPLSSRDGRKRYFEGDYVPRFDAGGRCDGLIGYFRDVTARKQTEEALRASEAMFAALFQESAVAMALTSLHDGRIHDVNRAWLALTGFAAREEVIGKSTAELGLIVEHQKRQQMIEALRREGHVLDAEQTIRTKSGALRRALVNLSVVDIGGHKFILSTNQDITERKQAEDALRESERLYRAIGESIDYGIWICDAHGRNTYTSESLLKLVGITQDQCAAFGWGDVLHPEDRDATVAAWKDCVRNGTLWYREHRYRGADGAYHPILACGVPVRNERGEVTSWAGINLDISRLKQTEGELREREEQLRLFAEHAPAAIAMLDTQMRYVAASRRWLEDFKLVRQDVIGRSHYEIFPELPERWKEIHRRCLAGAVERADEDPFVRADGSTQWIRWEERPWHTGTGEVGGVIIFSEEVTARKQAAEALRESVRRFELLARTAGELLVARHLKPTLETLCREAMEYLDCQVCFNYVVEEPGGGLHLHASAGITAEEAKRLEWLEMGSAVCGCAAQDGCPIVAEHISTTPDPRTEFVKSMGVRAYACHPLLGPGGNVIGTLSFGTKTRETFAAAELSLMKALTDQVAAAMVRRQSERTLRTRMAAIDAAAEAVVITDAEGHIQYVNPAFTSVTGYGAAEAIGGNPRVLKSGLHPREFYEDLWRTIIAGKVWQNELMNRRKDGTVYPEEMTITPVLNPEGKIQNFIAIKRDITERRRTEERLKELSQRLSYHVDNSPLAVIEWGPDMRLTRWSAAAERMFGWKADEVLGRRMEDFRWIYKEDEAQVSEVSGHLKSGADPKRFSANRNYRKDGSVVHCEWYNSSLLDASGRLVSILSLVLDVTQRDQAEQALRQLNVELEARVAERTKQLAAANADLQAQMNAYHELETELAGLVEDDRVRLGMELHDNLCQQLAAAGLHAATLEKRLRGNGLPQADMAGRISEALNRAGEDAHVLARGLLPVQVEADGLMVALGGLAQRTQEMQGVRCVFECAAPVPVENNAVATHLFRMAQEAIHNAVKHGHARHIVVELTDGAGVSLTIRDDGRGIPPEGQRGSGSGLRIMAYRARVIEGRLTITRGENGGTVVQCVLSRSGNAS